MYKTYQSHLLEGCHHHYQYISSAVWGEEMSVFVTQKGQGILLLMRLPVHSQIPPPRVRDLRVLPYCHCPWRDGLIFQPSHAWVCLAVYITSISAAVKCW